MKIRVFFKDETSQDFIIQTYYKNTDELYTLVLFDGSFSVIENVSHMVMVR